MRCSSLAASSALRVPLAGHTRFHAQALVYISAADFPVLLALVLSTPFFSYQFLVSPPATIANIDLLVGD